MRIIVKTPPQSSNYLQKDKKQSCHQISNLAFILAVHFEYLSPSVKKFHFFLFLNPPSGYEECSEIPFFTRTNFMYFCYTDVKHIMRLACFVSVVTVSFLLKPPFFTKTNFIYCCFTNAKPILRLACFVSVVTVSFLLKTLFHQPFFARLVPWTKGSPLDGGGVEAGAKSQ